MFTIPPEFFDLISKYPVLLTIPPFANIPIPPSELIIIFPLFVNSEFVSRTTPIAFFAVGSVFIVPLLTPLDPLAKYIPTPFSPLIIISPLFVNVPPFVSDIPLEFVPTSVILSFPGYSGLGLGVGFRVGLF